MHTKKRLLIVEDQPEAAGVLAMMAQQFDCQALVADCGMSALDIASWWNPDVVTIDLGLPDIDGLKVAAALRPKLPAAKLVAVSGKQPDQSMLAAAGFDCYLQKSICLDTLNQDTFVIQAIRGSVNGLPQRTNRQGASSSPFQGAFSMAEPATCGRTGRA